MNQAVSDSAIDTGSDIDTSSSTFAGLARNVRDNADQLAKAARGALIQVSHSGNSLFQELVSAGQTVRARANGKTAGATDTATFDWQAWLASTLGLPTRKDIDSLNRKLDRISRKVNKLAREQQA